MDASNAGEDRRRRATPYAPLSREGSADDEETHRRRTALGATWTRRRVPVREARVMKPAARTALILCEGVLLRGEVVDSPERNS